MKTVWNQDKMLELLKDFYKVSNIRVGFFEPKGEELVAYPQNLSSYCRAVRGSSVGNAACAECDRMAYQYASRHKELYIYRCHAGLMEMIVPIQGRGVILGYLMMGQFRSDKETGDEQRQRMEYMENLGLKFSQVSALLENIPVLEESHIKAYAHLLQACAVYVWMEDYLKIQEAPLSKRVENYIINHLDEKISLGDLAKAFDVGKTTLCSALKDEMGMTVSELMRDIRIQEAKRLLKREDMTIAEIASRVGIEDYNYFTKVFKHETGCTPSAYRKKEEVKERCWSG